MEEVLDDVELGRATVSLGQRGARLRLAGVVPPLAGGLAWARDHRGEEDEQVDGRRVQTIGALNPASDWATRTRFGR